MNMQEYVTHQVYAHIVGRAMTCPATGAVLDVRTAVVVEDAQEKVLGVLSPEGWEQIKDGVKAKVPNLRTVINGEVQT